MEGTKVAVNVSYISAQSALELCLIISEMCDCVSAMQDSFANVASEFPNLLESESVFETIKENVAPQINAYCTNVATEWVNYCYDAFKTYYRDDVSITASYYTGSTELADSEGKYIVIVFWHSGSVNIIFTAQLEPSLGAVEFDKALFYKPAPDASGGYGGSYKNITGVEAYNDGKRIARTLHVTTSNLYSIAYGVFRYYEVEPLSVIE